MKETNLKEIFNLMYKKLKELEIDNRFSKWIDERRNKSFKEVKQEGDNFLFEILIATMFTSGFRSKIVDEKWPTIKKAFDNFNISNVSEYDEKKINEIINTPNIIKHIPKIKAVVENAKRITKIQKKYGSFVDYLGSFNNPLALSDKLMDFGFLGRETVWDYLKEIGFDTIKPDIHIRRILFRLGLISEWKTNPETIEEVFEVAKKMSKETGEKLSVIDAVVWFYGADRPEEIKKSICGSKPCCNECYLTESCEYYKTKYS